MHEPLQRASVQPGAGCATSRTVSSFRNAAERHTRGQVIPLGTLVTRPCPEIATKTTRRITNDEWALVAEAAIPENASATIRIVRNRTTP